MIEATIKKSHDEVRIVLDPHDGACHGQHNIAVWAARVGADVHVTFGWQGSVFLSEQGTQEFIDAMIHAQQRGEEIRAAMLEHRHE